MNEQQLRICEAFANGRVGVERGNAPPDEGFREVWLPKLAGRYIRPDGMPDHGYATPAEAMVAGSAFKQACRDALRRRNQGDDQWLKR